MILIIVGAVLVIVWCFGLVLNAGVIHTVRKCRKFHTPVNILIVGIAVCDVIMLVFAFPLTIISSFCERWIFGLRLCHFYGFIVTLFSVSNICIITAVTIDRYVVINKIKLGFKFTTYKASLTVLSCVWYGLLWATSPLVGWGHFVVDRGGVSCETDWSNRNGTIRIYNIGIIVMTFIVPVAIITFCYSKILRKVRLNRVQVPSTDHQQSMEEVRVGISSLLAIVLFLAAWLPYIALSLWSLDQHPTQVPVWAALIVPLLAKSTCVWNPVMFYVTDKTFRKAFGKLVAEAAIKLMKGHETTDTSTINTITFRQA